jgi:hypothetical protein
VLYHQNQISMYLLRLLFVAQNFDKQKQTEKRKTEDTSYYVRNYLAII